MHVYLYIDCRTPGCKARHMLKHVEWPTDDYGFVDVPAESFPFSLTCKCGQTHSYASGEVQLHTSLEPLHPPDFVSLLPDPQVKPSDTN